MPSVLRKRTEDKNSNGGLGILIVQLLIYGFDYVGLLAIR